MHDVSDMELLRDYGRHGSEAAFAELVQRHIALVYSVALRHVGIAAQAEEITQAVFVILARKAASLRPDTLLEGWLHETTRLAALSFLRGERRRQFREQEAYMQSTLQDINDASTWNQLAPLLDEAVSRLGKKDRDAVMLRFFKDQSLREVAAALNVNESAAQRRVHRAVEKLRRFFKKRGVALSSVAITGAISANSVQAAPVALAKSVTAVAIAKGAAASGSTLTLIKGALKLMAWTKAKTAIVIGIGILLAAGTTIVTVQEIVAHRPQAWQKGFDLTVLDTTPRQAKILPALRSRSTDINGWNEYHGMVLGLNESVTDIVVAAYNVDYVRVIFPVPVPEGKYDFISNVPKDQREALQPEIKKEFGLVGRRELIETNVLILTVQNRNAAGLKQSASATASVNRSNGLISFSNQPISNLHYFIETLLGTPVVDRTGLTGYFDLKWDSTHDELKKTVLDNLGLALVPGNDRIEFVVVEKAN